MRAIHIAGLVVTYGSVVVCWAFIILYQWLSRGRWRHDPMGRHLMALAGVDAAIFTMLTAANLWPFLALQMWFLWTYISVVAGISVVTCWRVVILWRAYHPRS